MRHMEKRDFEALASALIEAVEQAFKDPDLAEEFRKWKEEKDEKNEY